MHDTAADPNRLPSLVIADAVRGSTLKVVPLNAPDINALLQLGWLSEEKLWIVGHNNPAAGVYYEINVDSGKLSEGIPGARFAPSPDRRHMVQDEFVPHGAPPPHDTSVALLDDDRAYPPSSDQSYHRFGERYYWSPDSSHVAFIDTEPSAGSGSDIQFVVVLSVHADNDHEDRNAWARFPLPSQVFADRISWTDNRGIAIASGKKYYSLDLQTGKLAPLPKEPVSLQVPVVKDASGTFPIEDRYCPSPVEEH